MGSLGSAGSARTWLLKRLGALQRNYSIRFRFLLLVAIALLPIAALSVAQGWQRLKRDESDAYGIFRTVAAEAAEPDRNVFLIADEKLRALAAHRQRGHGGPACATLMGAQLVATPYISRYLHVDASGAVLCATAGRGGTQNFGAESWWAQLPLKNGPAIIPDREGRLSGAPRATLVVRPLFSDGQTFEGAMLAVVSGHWLDDLLADYELPASTSAAVLDRTGAILLSNAPDGTAPMFDAPPDLLVRMNREGFLPDYGAQHMMMAVAPLLPDDYFMGLAVQRSAIHQKACIPVAINLILPIFMLLFASAAIWFGADFIIMRWLGYLQRTTRAYAEGHYAVRPQRLREAPREFHALIEAIYAMADAIRDRDRTLRHAIEVKGALLRETHHRIKNNLQIVMSLLNLQAARLDDPTARRALDQARIRINALALVHRILQETEDQTTVDMKELLTALALQLQHSIAGDAPQLALEFNVLPMTLPTDMAVPLALFGAEAMINAYTHGFPPDAHGIVTIALVPFGKDQLKLSISDTGLGYRPDDGRGGTDTRLIKALAQQIGGTASIAGNAEGGTSAMLLMPDRRLDLRVVPLRHAVTSET